MSLPRLAGAALAALVITSAPARAETMDTPARAALVLDLPSGAVLLAKEPDTPLPPASMSKLMTLNMVFEALEEGRLQLGDEFRISERAAAMKGSTMFLRSGSVATVEDLVRGVAIQSGNDAAVALAEALAGTEAAFAARMTERARELGLENSHFANSTGWPHPEHRMSVRDLALLGARLVSEFPQHYHYFAEREFTWDEVTQPNRNPLLDLGADGLKTGHTEEAGYGIVASAARDGRRVVVVITGLESEEDRKTEAGRLIDWAFRAFESRKLVTAGEAVTEAEVWIGEEPAVRLAPARDVVLTAPYGTLDEATAQLRYDAPVEAPVAAGDEIGQIVLTVPGMEPITVPLLAMDAVERGGFVPRVKAAGTLLLDQVLPGSEDRAAE